MSFLNKHNKAKYIELENNKLLYSIPKIEDTSLIRKPGHYFNYGWRTYNLISKKSLTFGRGYTKNTASFVFDMDEKFIPFTKLIPKLESNNSSNISFLISHSWNQLSGGKIKLIVTYTYSTDYQIDDAFPFTGYLTLDLAVKNFVLPKIAHGPQL